MDQNVLNYIKKMFAMETTPTWSPSYEGVIFYDKTLKRWVIGRNDGWQIIDRRFQTFQELPNIEWIDPFEYDTDEYLKSKWIINTVSGSGYYSIIIDSDKIDENLTDFPVMINLSGSSGIGSFDATQIFDDLGANSKKIKVKNSSGIELYCEIEMWDDTAEKAVLHVKVDSISSSADTELTLECDSTWSDNATYIGETGDSAAESVWDSDFVAVYHMNQDPSDGGACLLDSTGNGNNGTPQNMSIKSAYDVDYGKAISFDGGNDYVSLPSALLVGADNDFTVEGVVYPNNTTEFYSNAYSFSDENHLRLRVSGFNLRDNAVGGRVTLSVDTLGTADSSIHHLAGVFDKSEKEISVWLDGTNKGSDSDVNFKTMSPDMAELGRYFDNAGYDIQYFDGYVAEFRQSNILRSNAWIKATNATLKNNLITIT
jgi:hypothetical protein